MSDRDERGNMSGSRPARTPLVGVRVGIVTGSAYAVGLWLLFSLAPLLSGGAPRFEYPTPDTIPGIIWIATVPLFFVGTSVWLLFLSAREVEVTDDGLRVTMMFSGKKTIDKSLLLRPVIDRGWFGGVIYLRKGRKFSTLLVSHNQAQEFGRRSFYPSLPVVSLYRRHPDRVAKYETRLRRK